MGAEQHSLPKRGFLSGPHKPTEQTQAVQHFQHLLQVTEELWPVITACCVAPWLPDHEASQPELPEEVSALHSLAAAMHSKCMASDQFMAAIQQEAAGMTARQTEQLQVLLYAMEDFSFADFMHLAVYHKRDIFAPSPIGVSPRTWNPESTHPALSRPTQQLPDENAAASNHRSCRAFGRSPIGTKPAPVDIDNSEKARLDAEAERLRIIEVPQMEKWAQLLQSGGLSRHVHTKPASMATLATLTRLKRRAASARRNLAMKLPLKLQTARSTVSGDFGGKGLALEVCRPNDAVLQSWDDKIFPGEGVGFESACDNTFTGIKGKPSRQRAASSLGFAASGNSLLPPILHRAASRGPVQAKTARAIGEQQGSGIGHALPDASQADGTCLDNQLVDMNPLLTSCSTAAVGVASSTAAEPPVEVAEASEGSTAALDAQTALPSAVSSNLPSAHQTDMLLAMPSSRQLSFAIPDVKADADMPSSSTASLNDGTRAEEEEQAKERHLESPGRFAAAQFLLMQQQQQQLQERRLAALKEAGKTDHMAAAQLLQQSEHEQTSSLPASLQPVLPQEFGSLFAPATKRAHRGAVGAEAVASSPVVLFSPGGPYCDKSKWYQSAGMQQGQAERPSSSRGSAIGSAVAPRTCKVPSLGLLGTTGKAGAPLASVSRSGSLLDAEALMTGRFSNAATSALTSRKGRSGNAPAATASSDSDGAETLDSHSVDSSAAATAAASKHPRYAQPAEGQQSLPAEAGFMHSQQQQQQRQPWMQLNKHSSAVAESWDEAQPVQTSSRDGAVSLVSTTRANLSQQTVRSQSSIPCAFEPLPHQRSALRSAASIYAASGVVDDLFRPRDTYVNGDAEPMTKAMHHFGLSSEQVAADIKKQKEFASGLAVWYKSQLKRHARINAPGGRVFSRSNSRSSDKGTS